MRCFGPLPTVLVLNPDKNTINEGKKSSSYLKFLWISIAISQVEIWDIVV